MRSLYNRKFLFLFTAIVIISFFSKTVFAVWNGTFYNPGDTLNPECLPTQTDCDVLPPLTSLTGPLLLGGTSTTSDLSLQTTSGVGATGADMHFLVGNNGATEAMTILNSGNVGIGNTAPGELLTLGTAGTTAGVLSLAGATSGKAILQVAAEAGTPTLTLPTTTGTLALVSDLTTGYIPYTGGTTNVDLGLHNLTVDTNSLFVDSVNHRVGIGTVTPSYPLDIVGSLRASVNIYSSNNIDATGQVSATKFGPHSSTGDVIFYKGDGTTELMRMLNSNGNVGIGITAPTSRIHGVTTLSAATGDEVAYSLDYTTNKATSGNDTGLLINMTDTASPGTSYPLDIKVGGVSKFSVNNAGNLSITGKITMYGDLAFNATEAFDIGATRATGPRNINMTGELTMTDSDSSALTDFLINPTVKTSGNLIDAQVGGVSKFSVTNAGVLNTASVITSGNSTFNGASLNWPAWANIYAGDSGGTLAGNSLTVQPYTTKTNTSGNSATLQILSVYNQASGTAANTDLLINRTETAVGSGAQYLIDAQVGGTTKFNVDNTGAIGLGTAPLYRIQIAGAAKNTVYYGLNTSAIAAGDTMNYGVASNAVVGAVNGFSYSAQASTGFNNVFYNTDTTNGTADASFEVRTGGASGGDPKTIYTVSGVTNWVAGIDNSDSDKYKIAYGAALGTGTVLTAQSDGNVGIGTTAPTSILSLGGTAARTIQMERNTTAATAGQGLTLSSGGAIAGTADLAGGDLTLKSGISTGTGTSALRFFTATAGTTGTTDNTPTEKMTILGSGNVGIGVTNPGYKLDIQAAGANLHMQSTTGINGVYQYLNNTGGMLYLGIEANTGSAVVTSGPAYDAFFGTGNNTGLRLITNSVNRLYIKGDGNVGIGTIAPTSHLQIDGNLSATAWTTDGIAFDSNAATFTDTSTAAAGTVAVRTANSFGAPTFASTNAITVTDAFTLYVPKPIAGTNTTITRANSAYFEGNVGIGTTAPASLLDVEGVAFLLNATTSASFEAYASAATAKARTVASRTLLIGADVPGLVMSSGYKIAWSSNAANAGDAYQLNDTGLSRGAAGKLYVGNGTAGDFTGTLIAGNIKIAGTAVRATTEGTNHLDIFDGTAPVGTLANGISLYSTAGELRVMDAAGNATLLSPHENINNYWVFDSTNEGTGKSLVIDMELMMKELNDTFDWDYVHETGGDYVKTENTSFWDKMFVKIIAWLAEKGNGINELCINETCVTEDQLQTLLQNAGMTSIPETTEEIISDPAPLGSSTTGNPITTPAPADPAPVDPAPLVPNEPTVSAPEPAVGEIISQ